MKGSVVGAASHAGIPAGPTPIARHPLLLRAAAMMLMAGLAAAVLMGVTTYQRHTAPEPLPPVARRPIFPTLFDVTPTEVITTQHWTKVPILVPRWQFLADHTIWQRMHFEDWDRLDEASRRAGLTRLVERYGHLVADARAWPTMTAEDWDAVPQPIRAMAIVGMIEHWVGFYDVGSAFGLDPGLVLRTTKAIAMAESWFDHRALHRNRDGSMDVGIGGASDFARRTLRRWHEAGLADFTLGDDEYYNPWLASRWLAFWMDLTIHEADGDLDVAVRAYNWGIGRALAGGGADYLDAVRRRRQRYFEGPSDSPTWFTLSQYRRAPWTPMRSKDSQGRR